MRTSVALPLSGHELTENPFASTHSLDQNPFDDPTTTTAADLERREREVREREAQLEAREAAIKTRGKNNWPFCAFSYVWHAMIFLGCACV